MPDTPHHAAAEDVARPHEQRPAASAGRTPGTRTFGARSSGTRNADPRSTVELVNDLLELVPRLIREELALATAEMREKGKRAGVGAGLFTGGGVLALYGGAALVAAAVLGLARAVPDWLAALVVGVVLLAVAGVLALIARRQVARATPPAPQHTIESVREDIATVKDAAAGERTPARTS